MNQNAIVTLEDVIFAVLKFTYETDNGKGWVRNLNDLCKVINCDNENLVIDALKLMAGNNYFNKIVIYPLTNPSRPLTYNPKQHKIEKFIRFPGGFYISPNEKARERYEELSKKRLENRINKVPLRIYIEDIDNFKDVCQFKPEKVIHLLDKNGRLEMKEDDIQIALEDISGEKFHKKDWPGEDNDLYTSNITISGNRIAAAFMLKGKGTKNIYCKFVIAV